VVTEAVNQLHKTLRVLSHEDGTLQRAISFLHGCIKLQTHDTIKADPGVQAWFAEHMDALAEIARKRRAAYEAANEVVNASLQ
jgi:hypothetical protein